MRRLGDVPLRRGWLGVSFETCLRRRRDELMGRYVLLRRCDDDDDDDDDDELFLWYG